MKYNKQAFTLVEILVVVLIIGILTAIAVPMYQSTVDKTHWSTLLPTARALKNAEEAYLMATNVYTDNADALDVAATEGDATYELQMPGSDALYAIRATTPKLPSVRLAQYLDDNAIRAGQLYCESNDGEDGRGTKLCEKLLNGQELGTTDDGYTQYLLDQEVDKATCNGVSRVWSNKNTKCFKTEKARCEANGMPYENGFCGYHNTKNMVIEEGGTCLADLVGGGSGCNGSTIKPGGKCENVPVAGTDYDAWTSTCSHLKGVDGGVVICHGGLCGWDATFDNGSVCVAMQANPYNSQPCIASSFKNGSICYGNVSGGCNSGHTSYDSTSCCCGNYCGSKPKCADRGVACDPQYLK